MSFTDEALRIQVLAGGPFKKFMSWRSHHGSGIMNLISIHEDVSPIPGLAQWVSILAEL